MNSTKDQVGLDRDEIVALIADLIVGADECTTSANTIVSQNQANDRHGEKELEAIFTAWAWKHRRDQLVYLWEAVEGSEWPSNE